MLIVEKEIEIRNLKEILLKKEDDLHSKNDELEKIS